MYVISEKWQIVLLQSIIILSGLVSVSLGSRVDSSLVLLFTHSTAQHNAKNKYIHESDQSLHNIHIVNMKISINTLYLYFNAIDQRGSGFSLYSSSIIFLKINPRFFSFLFYAVDFFSPIAGKMRCIREDRGR